jgi:hypothetical protein
MDLAQRRGYLERLDAVRSLDIFRRDWRARMVDGEAAVAPRAAPKAAPRPKAMPMAVAPRRPRNLEDVLQEQLPPTPSQPPTPFRAMPPPPRLSASLQHRLRQDLGPEEARRLGLGDQRTPEEKSAHSSRSAATRQANIQAKMEALIAKAKAEWGVDWPYYKGIPVDREEYIRRMRGESKPSNPKLPWTKPKFGPPPKQR